MLTIRQDAMADLLRIEGRGLFVAIEQLPGPKPPTIYRNYLQFSANGLSAVGPKWENLSYKA